MMSENIFVVTSNNQDKIETSSDFLCAFSSLEKAVIYAKDFLEHSSEYTDYDGIDEDDYESDAIAIYASTLDDSRSPIFITYMDVTKNGQIVYDVDFKNSTYADIVIDTIESKHRYRYYSIHRPIDIGTIPMEPSPDKIVNFEYGRKAVGDFLAWGYVEYSEPLDPSVAADYELRTK